MKRFIVEFHGQNDEEIPEIWPKEIIEVKNLDSVPPDSHVMTEEQYSNYIEKHKHLYDKWRVEKYYKSNYKNFRKKEYPSNDEILEALFDVVVSRLIDKRNFPEKIQSIIDKKAAIDAKYPEPS